jgi:hypothetical protein
LERESGSGSIIPQRLTCCRYLRWDKAEMLITELPLSSNTFSDNMIMAGVRVSHNIGKIVERAEAFARRRPER